MQENVTSHEVSFFPFTTDELVADLEDAGFNDIMVRQNPGDDLAGIIAMVGQGVIHRLDRAIGEERAKARWLAEGPPPAAPQD